MPTYDFVCDKCQEETSQYFSFEEFDHGVTRRQLCNLEHLMRLKLAPWNVLGSSSFNDPFEPGLGRKFDSAREKDSFLKQKGLYELGRNETTKPKQRPELGVGEVKKWMDEL